MLADPKSIYEQIVQSPDDAIGAFAYVIYEGRRADFIKQMLERDQTAPTEQQFADFNLHQGSAKSIAEIREQGEALANRFLQAGLKAQITQIEHNLRESVIGQELVCIKGKFDEKKTLWGWCRDVGGNLLVNFLTLILIGLLVLGIHYLEKMNSKAEDGIGLSSAPASTPEQTVHTDK